MPVIVIHMIILFIWKRQGIVRMTEAEATYYPCCQSRWAKDDNMSAPVP